jgi:hypothetical protein
LAVVAEAEALVVVLQVVVGGGASVEDLRWRISGGGSAGNI